jgi:ABC-2 type transport system ATP-binding protein
VRRASAGGTLPRVPSVIELSGLVKRYRGVAVLDGIDWRVERGGVHHLRGAAGAGKTTLARVLLGLVPPDAGLALVLGHDARRLPGPVRRRLGWSPERPGLPPRASVGRLLSATGRPAPDWLGLDGARRAGTLTAFERRRLELALALATDPELVLLDGLDHGLAAAELDELLERCDAAAAAHGTTFLWTGAAPAPAGREGALLAAGRVVAEAAP